MGRKIGSFEELEVFQSARDLNNKIFTCSEASGFRSYTLRDQMRRAAISVISNIAEGYEKRTKAERIHFLYTAKGSAGELRAQLLIAFDQKYVSEEKYNILYDQCKKVSCMLSNFIKYLSHEEEKGR